MNGIESKKITFHKTFILISAAAFFCLEFSSLKYLLGLPLAIAAIFIILRKIDLQKELESNLPLKLFSLFNAAGTCVYGVREFYFLRLFSGFFENSDSKTGAVLKRLGFEENSSRLVFILIAILGAVVGFYFAYILVLSVTKRLLSIIKRNNLLDFSKTEKITYSVLFAIFAIFIAFVYLHSDLFFPSIINDTIFSADGELLIVKQNAFLSLAHGENDLRQPLFAVFALPFSGIPYLLSLLIPFRWSLPLFTNLVNLVLLIFSTTILARLLHLQSKIRICFVILSSLTFSHIMFSLFIEQYVIAFFYFLLFVYVVCEKKRISVFLLYGATGTLTTSCIASFFILDFSSAKKFFRRFKKLIFLALGFAFLMISLCRTDVFLDLKTKIKNLSSFAGSAPVQTTLTTQNIKSKSDSSKISNRFLAFVESSTYYFASPRAEIRFAEDDYNEQGKLSTPAHYFYATSQSSKFSIAGTLILAFSILSIVLNRKKTFARFATFWLCFNFLLTCVLGWGLSEQENTLFLYSLYFGWVYFVLIFMLVQNVLLLFHAEKFLSLVCVVCSAGLLALNIPSVKQILDFAFTYYPL